MSWVGGRIPKHELYQLVELSVKPDEKVSHEYTSNLTIVKCSSLSCETDAASFVHVASGYANHIDGEPYQFTKAPVLMRVNAIWKHLRQELLILARSRETRSAVHGRLTKDKRPDKSQGDRSHDRDRSDRRGVRSVEVDDHHDKREVDHIMDGKCFRCGKTGPVAAACSQTKDVCYTRSSPDHIQANCPKKDKGASQRQSGGKDSRGRSADVKGGRSKSTGRSEGAPAKCDFCKSTDHGKRQCPERTEHCYVCNKAGKPSKHDYEKCKCAAAQRKDKGT